MWSKIVVLLFLLMAVHLVSGRPQKASDEKVWVFESDREIDNPRSPGNKMPQIVCYGWYCKRVESAAAICKGADFSLTPKTDYTCRIVNLGFTYKLSEYSITCKDFDEPTNDNCFLTVKVEDAD